MSAGASAGAGHRGPARQAVMILAGIMIAFGASTGAVAGSRGYTDLRRIAPIHGDAAAGARKATLCVSCHGADGQSVAPTFPRLAGQRVDYLYHRLRSFHGADPMDPYYSASPMTAMAAALSDTDMRDLAAYFAAQTPGASDPAASPTTSPAASTAGDVSGQDPGARLYLHGDPARGIPPCQGCHGADAGGPILSTGQYLAYPLLRGQYAAYVSARLTNFRDGRPSDTSNTFIMHGIAATLDDEAIQAIAAWIGSLPPVRH